MEEQDKPIINRMIHDQLESLGIVPLMRQPDKFDLLFKEIRSAIQKGKGNHNKDYSLSEWIEDIHDEISEMQITYHQYKSHGGDIERIREEAIDSIVVVIRMIIEKLDLLIERAQRTKEEAERIVREGTFPS